MFASVDEQLEVLRRGTVEIVPEDELTAKLERSRQADRPLVVKQGFDPTRPDLHIGHAVSLYKLRDFQRLGHRVVFLIGDFTARVGDPSGQSEMRPVLTEEEIAANLLTYKEQVERILDPKLTEVRRNSEWLAPLDLADVLRITSLYTVARMLERDDFAQRHADGSPISMAEFMYPMMQGYDSVALEADVELGGTDQKFNLLLARTLQERSGQEPQVCMIMPLLRGTDGDRKMSKSYDNYVGLTMEADEMFGRTMSIPDDLLGEWLSLASSARDAELEERLRQAGENPLETKRWLAEDLVRRYHDDAAAGRARDAFDRVHREREVPEDVTTCVLEADEDTGTLWIGYVLTRSDLASSTSEAARLLAQGAVRVDRRSVTDGDLQLAPGTYIIQKGKRAFVRLDLRSAGGS